MTTENDQGEGVQGKADDLPLDIFRERVDEASGIIHQIYISKDTPLRLAIEQLNEFEGRTEGDKT